MNQSIGLANQTKKVDPPSRNLFYLFSQAIQDVSEDKNITPTPILI
jgi:hypothetical protein